MSLILARYPNDRGRSCTHRPGFARPNYSFVYVSKQNPRRARRTPLDEETLNMRLLEPQYVIAFIVACLLIAGGAAFCAHTRQSLINLCRQQFEKTVNTDETSAEIIAMLDKGIIPPNIEISVPPPMLIRISISDWLVRLWHVWVIATFGACFSAAFLLTYLPYAESIVREARDRGE